MVPGLIFNKAKSLVQTSLDGWKNGENPSQMASHSIEIHDPDWKKGHKLLDFSIKSSLEMPQQGPRVVVMLTTQEKGKKQKTTEVAYEVIVGEKSKISRDPFHIP